MRAKSLIIPAMVVMLSISVSAQQKADKDEPSRLLGVLEKSGYSYTKVKDGVYEVPATGNNLKDFPIRLAESGSILVVIVKLADRKDVALKEGLTVKLLELNDNYDMIKFALNDEMLYARIDIHTRLVDTEEIKYLVEVMAHAVDEGYPQIKQFLPGAK